MFGRLRKLFGTKLQPEQLSDAIAKAVRAATSDMDWEDPAVRTGASLYFILSKQFDLIGKPDGQFPYTPPFASDKARGALLGTAIAIAKQQNGEQSHEALVDAVVTAFTLTYGAENGRFYALQTIKDASDGNEDVNFASDWAIKDTDGASGEDSPATPAAFYLAVADLI